MPAAFGQVTKHTGCTCDWPPRAAVCSTDLWQTAACSYSCSHQALARRIMVVRESLATALTGPGLPQFLARANLEARPVAHAVAARREGVPVCATMGKCKGSTDVRRRVG